MAHTIWGTFDGALTQYIRPYIEVDWTQNQSQNTSTVTATLYFHRYTNNYWSYNELTNSNGHSCTFSVGGSSSTQIRPFNLQRENPPNRVAVWTRTRTITHNSNGTATVNISAEGTTNVNPNTYDFGETVTLPTIPRESSIGSLSMDDELAPNTDNRISIVIDRQWSGYSHKFEILNGTDVIHSSTGTFPTGFTISSTAVNKMIGTMRNDMSKNFTFRLTTLDGNTVIGSDTANLPVTLDDDRTKPSIVSENSTIIGSGRDSVIGKFVQNVSRVRTQFQTFNGFGASERSLSVRVGGISVPVSTLSSGTKRADSGVLNLTGTKTVRITTTNSRGQTGEAEYTITFHAYSPPRITRFSGYRSDSNATSVIVSRRHSRTSLNGDNTPMIGKIERRLSTSSSWSEVNTSNLISLDTTITGNNAARSYVFRTTITDSFGNSASSEFSVGTAEVLMEKFKDEGVSFGKRFESGKGTLQVMGDIQHITKSGVESSLTSPIFRSANLQNGWTNRAQGGSQVGYYKVGGLVFLVGNITKSASTNTGEVIMTLPAAYRPSTTYVFYIDSDNIRVDINSSGQLLWQWGNVGTAWMSLNSISFPI